jgi:hypothetical protein
MLAELFKIKYETKGLFHLLNADQEVNSQLSNQCQGNVGIFLSLSFLGMLIDFQNHSIDLLAYPWDFSQMKADWPQDQTHKEYKNFVSIFKYKGTKNKAKGSKFIQRRTHICWLQRI